MIRPPAPSTGTPTPGVPSMGALDWVLLLNLSVLWGASFFLAAVALKGFPPFTVVIGRAGVAAATLYFVIRAVGQRMPRDPKIWVAFAVMGIGNNLIPFSLICWAQTKIPSGLASILNATTPLLAVILCHWLTHDEKLTANKIFGVAVGIGGVAIMVGIESLGGLDAQILAEMACLGAALCYALAGIYGRRLKSVSFLVVACGQATMTTVLLLPIWLIVDRPWAIPTPGMTPWLAILGLGVLCTAVGHSLYFRILSTSGATNVLLVTLLVPVSAVWLGWSVLDERLGTHQLLGMAVIGAGLIWVDGRLFGRRRRRAAP